MFLGENTLFVETLEFSCTELWPVLEVAEATLTSSCASGDGICVWSCPRAIWALPAPGDPS